MLNGLIKRCTNKISPQAAAWNLCLLGWPFFGYVSLHISKIIYWWKYCARACVRTEDNIVRGRSLLPPRGSKDQTRVLGLHRKFFTQQAILLAPGSLFLLGYVFPGCSAWGSLYSWVYNPYQPQTVVCSPSPCLSSFPESIWGREVLTLYIPSALCLWSACLVSDLRIFSAFLLAVLLCTFYMSVIYWS